MASSGSGKCWASPPTRTRKYDVAWTLTGAADAAGTALFRMRYVSGN
jgi:hypothetical protein